ncbi:MAG: alpha/beta fold hydrolase [Candidatus Eisenbacteria bacterium]|uniref:Alpha/beta fold hydrolase n=1 Tax=Eiseniibacteriota bacterium TaxID=2212470 RepID=A0A538T4K0_UNCEI|nr:MAG: alpha/beta fold hydrolase [Candidatus Eisenbacteria bacterium]
MSCAGSRPLSFEITGSWREIFRFSRILPEISSPEPVEIEGADGGPLRLDLYAPPAAHPDNPPSATLPRPPIVLLHGFRGYKDWGFFPMLAGRMAEAGFPAVTFSVSGSGIAGRDGAFTEPERFRRNTYAKELADLARVVAWALAPGAARAGLIGHSRGGTLALLHAASNRRIGCVATLAAPFRIGVWKPEQTAAWERGEDAPIYDFRTRTHLRLGPDLWEDFTRNRDRYDAARAIESLGAPLLVVQGDRDAVVPPENAVEIASHASSVMTELLILEGAGHSFQAGDRIRRTPPQLLDMVEAVTAWMRRWLSRPLQA